MIQFSRKYFIFTIILFAVELLIALFIRDRIIRPHLGDLLVVLLIYCAIKTVFNLKPRPLTIGVVLFAFGVETAQYFNMVDLLGVADIKFFRITLGASFDPFDLIMYTLGGVIIILFEKNSLRGDE